MARAMVWWCGGVGKVFSLLFVLVVRVSDRFSHTNMPVVDRGGASVGALSYVMKCFKSVLKVDGDPSSFNRLVIRGIMSNDLQDTFLDIK